MKGVLQKLSFLAFQNNDFPGPVLGKKPWCSKREVPRGFHGAALPSLHLCILCLNALQLMWAESLPPGRDGERPQLSNFSSLWLLQKLCSGHFFRLMWQKTTSTRGWCALTFSQDRRKQVKVSTDRISQVKLEWMFYQHLPVVYLGFWDSNKPFFVKKAVQH